MDKCDSSHVFVGNIERVVEVEDTSGADAACEVALRKIDHRGVVHLK